MVPQLDCSTHTDKDARASNPHLSWYDSITTNNLQVSNSLNITKETRNLSSLFDITKCKALNGEILSILCGEPWL